MPEPLRRRSRAALLRALSACAGGSLDPLLRLGLAATTQALRWSRAGATTRANLELIYGTELSGRERAAIERGVQRHTASVVREWLWMARASSSPQLRARVEAWIEREVEFDTSVETLLERARRGRGVLVVSAHLGNWELLAAALRRRGLDGAVVGLHKPNDSSADWLVKLRAGLGVRSIAQDAPAREVLRVLAGGGVLGLMCDLHARRLDTLHTPFFGRPAPTMTAPAALARASGLPLTLARCVRVEKRYRLMVEPELELDSKLERSAATRDLLTRMNSVFERWIRQTPEQWAWHQRRWPSPQ